MSCSISAMSFYSLIMACLKYSQSSVLALEESALDTDQVENLIKFCPTKEEMELLKVGRLIMVNSYAEFNL